MRHCFAEAVGDSGARGDEVLQFTVGLWEGVEGSLRSQPSLNNATPQGWQKESWLSGIGRCCWKFRRGLLRAAISPVSAGGPEQVSDSASESASLGLNYNALIYSLCDAYLL